jgi:hypothetical protein
MAASRVLTPPPHHFPLLLLDSINYCSHGHITVSLRYLTRKSQHISVLDDQAHDSSITECDRYVIKKVGCSDEAVIREGYAVSVQEM